MSTTIFDLGQKKGIAETLSSLEAKVRDLTLKIVPEVDHCKIKEFRDLKKALHSSSV